VGRVERITSRLVAQAVEMRPETRSWDWTIRVIDEPQANAWAMPGGKMALYTGRVETIEPRDDELAQVLAHEIAHALVKHGAEKMSIALVSQLGVGAMGAASQSPEVARAAALALQRLPLYRAAGSSPGIWPVNREGDRPGAGAEGPRSVTLSESGSREGLRRPTVRRGRRQGGGAFRSSRGARGDRPLVRTSFRRGRPTRLGGALPEEPFP